MNRNLKRDRGCLEKGVVDLFLQVAIGATGAPTISTANSMGIASIARNSAGRYTITLQDRYTRLLSFIPTLVVAAGVPATASSAQLLVRADNSGAAAKTLVVEFVDNAGAAIELVSGVVFKAQIILKNSSIGG